MELLFQLFFELPEAEGFIDREFDHFRFFEPRLAEGVETIGRV